MSSFSFISKRNLKFTLPLDSWGRKFCRVSLLIKHRSFRRELDFVLICNIFDQSDRLLFGDFWSVSRSLTLISFTGESVSALYIHLSLAMMWSISDEKEDEFDEYLKCIQENWRFIKPSIWFKLSLVLFRWIKASYEFVR